MSRSEVIILSSDEESDSNHPIPNMASVTITKRSSNVVSGTPSRVSNVSKISFDSKNQKKKSIVPKSISKKNDFEVVDLVECSDKSSENKVKELKDQAQNHSNPDKINVGEAVAQNASVVKKSSNKDKLIENNESRPSCSNNTKVNNDISSNILKPKKICSNVDLVKKEAEKNKTVEDDNQNLQLFTEFVELCGSLEGDSNDRLKLTKKLMKRYGEAELPYIKSIEFKNLVIKLKNKVKASNLYVVAKEISDELSYRKKLEASIDVTHQNNTNIQKDLKNVSKPMNVEVRKTEVKRNKRRRRMIKKILMKLDKLGTMIRELEEKEVDLSDEEESSYIQLQRYRERFWQIYSKLCKFTDEIADANHVFNRKICFTESNYPEINKCIENWLNKTKKFPDFSDIMKLLENQSASLNLSSNREVIRTLATEIFQKVGAMLQRKRMYDLWDSFSGFLNNEEDPANNDPILDQILRNNYESRVKKEQEIFQHYAELQDKQKIEPEEVPDDADSHSPAESGDEDEKEIEEIENVLNRKLDSDIDLCTKNPANHPYNGEDKLEMEYTPSSKLGTPFITKETKNNYINCKSLKWRSGTTERNKEKDNCCVVTNNVRKNTEETTKVDSDLELIEDSNTNSQTETPTIATATKSFDSPSKRLIRATDKELPTKKPCLGDGIEKNKDVIEIDHSLSEKSKPVYNIHCCQVYLNEFEVFSERKIFFGKKRVFRDHTNLKRLKNLSSKTQKQSGWFSTSSLLYGYRNSKEPSWKQRHKNKFIFTSFKNFNCALNQDGHSDKTLNSNSNGNSDEQDNQNNSEGNGGEEGTNSLSGCGSGGEDNNDGEDKRNRINKDKGSEKPDDEEEKAEEEKIDSELNDCSLSNNKTEETNVIDPDSLKCDRSMSPSDKNSSIADFSNNEETTKAEKAQDKSGTIKKPEVKTNEAAAEKLSEVAGSTSKKAKASKNKRLRNYDQSRKNGAGESKFSEPKLQNSLLENKEKYTVEENKSKENFEVNAEEKDIEVKPSEEESDNNYSMETDKLDESEIESSEIEKSSKSKGKKKNENKPCAKRQKKKFQVNENRCDLDKSNDKKSKVTLKTSTEKSNIDENTVAKNAIVETESEKKENVDLRNSKKEETSLQPKAPRKRLSVKGGSKLFDLEKNEPSRAKDSSPDLIEIPCDNSAAARNVRNISSDQKVNKINYGKNNSKIEAPKQDTNTWKSPQIDLSLLQQKRKSTQSLADEERVKRFLMNSPSSISITPPRKLSGQPKPPSPATLQALAQLSKFKGISASLVRGKPKNEDDVVVIGGSYRKPNDQNMNAAKRRKIDPVVPKVQSHNTTPKIVTVQGNASGFGHLWPARPSNSNAGFNTSSIRISNVWGSLPNPQVGRAAPQTSTLNYRQSNPGTSNVVRKKNTEKKVEYVELD